MNTIRRYWIIEIALFLIAIIAFGFVLFGSGGGVNAGQQVAAPTPTLVSAETEQAGNQAADIADEDEDVEIEDDDELAADDAEAQDEQSEGEEPEFELIDRAAQLLQIDVETLEVGLQAGLPLAAIANEQGFDAQQLITTLVEEERAFIDTELQNGRIEQAEADEWRAEVATFTPFFVEYGYLEPETIAANMLGIELEAFWEALEGGQTIAKLAAAQNVDVETIMAAAMAEEEKLIDYLLNNGEIDSADADEWRTEHAVYLSELINS